MPLNTSGPISLGGSTAGQSIALELGLSATGTISLNTASVRSLAGVPSGQIVMPTDFWGKSFGRGLFAGGQGFANMNAINYVTIATVGNALDFGDLTVGRYYFGAGASTTRAIWGGGYPDTFPYVNVIDYVTILTTGNAIDFGDTTTTANYGITGTSNATRLVFAGGSSDGGGSTSSAMLFVTIATLGNTSNFGNLTQSRMQASACASSTRGLFCGGYAADGINNRVNIIDFTVFSSGGGSTDFGDLLIRNDQSAACSSPTRGLIGGGLDNGSPTNAIQYVTLASAGNSIDFGDLTVNRYSLGATSSSVRAVWASNVSSGSNTMDYSTIASTGNALNFGNLVNALVGNAGTSNAHGGL